MLLDTLQYEPFQWGHCACGQCMQCLAPVNLPVEATQATVHQPQPPRPPKQPLPPRVHQWGYNLQPRYMGSLVKTFSPFELGAMQRRVTKQVAQLGALIRTPGTRTSGLVGTDSDFELTLGLGRVLCDGLPTLDVLHLAWAPYSAAGHYWKQPARDNCLAILLALEKYANTIKRRVRLVDVPVPRLCEYFHALRGYTSQSDNAYCMLDTAQLDPLYYEQ